MQLIVQTNEEAKSRRKKSSEKKKKIYQRGRKLYSLQFLSTQTHAASVKAKQIL